MLAHYLVEGVAVEADHEEVEHVGLLPPGAALGALGQQQPGGEADGDGLARAGPLQADHLADAVPQTEQSQQVQEGNRALRVILSVEVAVGDVLEDADGLEGKAGDGNSLKDIGLFNKKDSTRENNMMSSFKFIRTHPSTLSFFLSSSLICLKHALKISRIAEEGFLI